MFQILLYHLFHNLSHSRTKIALRTEILPQVFLPYMRKFLKPLDRCPPLNPSHDLARGHSRRAAHHEMHMILAHHSLEDPDLKRLTALSDQGSHQFHHFPRQYLVLVFPHSYKVILYLKNIIASIPILHAAPPPVQLLWSAKAGGLNLVVEI